MTQNTDTQSNAMHLAILGMHAESIQKFCNAQGRFWHRIFVLDERPTNRPSQSRKGWAYDGAYHINTYLGRDRAETMLDLLDALDAYNVAAADAAHGAPEFFSNGAPIVLKPYRVMAANRAAIVATLNR